MNRLCILLIILGIVPTTTMTTSAITVSEMSTNTGTSTIMDQKLIILVNLFICHGLGNTFSTTSGIPSITDGEKNIWIVYVIIAQCAIHYRCVY